MCDECIAVGSIGAFLGHSKEIYQGCTNSSASTAVLFCLDKLVAVK